MRLVLPLVISGLLLFCSHNSLAWEQQPPPQDGVEVWRDQGKPFDKVRVESIVQAPMLPLLALLQDPVKQLNWFPYLKKVEVIEKVSPTQTLVHVQTGSALFIQPRDAVTLFIVSQPDPERIEIEMQNEPNAIPELKGHKRVQSSMGHWQLTALPGCQTRVRFEAGSQWGGVFPQWLADKSNVEVAIETVVNLKQWAADHYKDYQPYDFLQASVLHENCT